MTYCKLLFIGLQVCKCKFSQSFDHGRIGRIPGVRGREASSMGQFRGEVAAGTVLRPVREHVERLVEMAEHLEEADAALIRAVYERGLGVTELARAVGQRRQRIQRRLGRLVRRISSRSFGVVVRNRGRWPEPRRLVGELIVLRGLTQREAARRAGLSVHEVRQHIASIRALAEAADGLERDAA
jgi:DNA-directed RNA polymerase specialized sigma24 family protein